MTPVDAAEFALALPGPCAVVNDGDQVIVAADPDEVVVASGDDAFRALDRLDDGLWCGWMTYNLGRTAVGLPSRSSNADLVLARFATRHTFPRITSGRATRPVAAVSVRSGDHPERTWQSSLSPDTWRAAVEVIQRHEAAGDCYQVNLTRQLRTANLLEPRGLFRRLAEANPAPHAALIDLRPLISHAIVSASPERFLSVHDRAVTTRPIKGTGSDADCLQASIKDRAENTMIVDLARNDLGRVCRYGSVHVPELCELEDHPGLFHLVSSVHGTLRPEVGYGDLFRATIPAASITGAPKHRVLQIIDAIEPEDRGVYCGGIGWIDTEHRRAEWNVAIRTFEIGPSGTSLGVGAGITIDSDATQEWNETELKAHRLVAAAAHSGILAP